jgi:hypothetical protein
MGRLRLERRVTIKKNSFAVLATAVQSVRLPLALRSFWKGSHEFRQDINEVGLVLIIATWLLASSMPEAAARDFDKLVAANGGSISHTPNFPDEYRKMGFARRLLQNSLLGLTGLICLSIGLDAYRREPATPPIEVEFPNNRSRTPLHPVLRHLWTGALVLAASVVLWVVALMLQV